ncbi:GNAT superfamily N-acetyltransferase [Deinobacterium chartae]|uniref:GNAT superfamily N-acetyltransferase n=1 Tax=Deinobacterium chartae TaxID=521158 RepID=A0A841I092_9DEIO|nr:GNAT family N-acetyltransferase [Deinobacterium chartae]MBB6097668.1 GNAT superfamily N-acetyltransferase [Deinobacterium chartae]
MSEPKLRPYLPDDATALEALLSELEAPYGLEALLAGADGTPDPGWLICQEGVALGAATLSARDMAPGVCALRVAVHPRRRGQGLGRALARAALTHPAAQHLTLEIAVPDDRPGLLAWAGRHGFAPVGHRIRSELELRADLEAVVLPADVRVTTLAQALQEASDPETVWDALHVLLAELASQIPDEAGRRFTPQDVQLWARGAPDLDPHSTVLAYDGARLVGLVLMRAETPRLRHIGMTGVTQEWRGRGLARVLKLEAARASHAQGATHLRTDNDASNTAILRLNRSLGYRSLGGLWRLRRPPVNDR